MVNLHIHSYYSDGKSSPAEILDLVNKYDLEYFSVTDHDNVNFYSCVNDKRLIKGVELSCDYKNGTCHMLGYNIDLDIINEFCKKIIKSRQEKGLKLIKHIKDKGYEISIDDIGNKNNIIGKRDIINKLLDKKYFENYEDAEKLFDIEIDTVKPSVEECVNIIKSSGGIPVIAHPWTLNLDINELEQFLKKYKILGIEVYNHEISDSLYKELDSLADKLNLYKTVGTDFHGYKGFDKILVEKHVDTSKILKRVVISND